jgi:hypothetical protein
MLLRVLFLVLFVAALAEAAIHGAATLARASLQQQELSALRVAFVAAVAAAQSAAPQGSIPTPFATCYLASDAGCEISATATISSPTPSSLATPIACPSTNCTIYLQTNSAVAESRTAYHVVTRVNASNGDTLLSRQADVAFRTFATAPYASLVGSLDATLDALEDGGAGDNGGNAGAAGTLIDVEYVPSGASASPVPGNVWRAQAQHPATAGPSWDR